MACSVVVLSSRWLGIPLLFMLTCHITMARIHDRPGKIKAHSETWHPAYVSDYMPTLLEILGVKHQHPGWVADGISLVRMISTDHLLRFFCFFLVTRGH